jgi:hypothetical protein
MRGARQPLPDRLHAQQPRLQRGDARGIGTPLACGLFARRVGTRGEAVELALPHADQIDRQLVASCLREAIPGHRGKRHAHDENRGYRPQQHARQCHGGRGAR